MTASEVWSMVKQAAKDWVDDSASRLAAALAYYTIFSLAPLLVIAVVVMGTIMRNNNDAKEKVVSYVTSTAQGIDANTIRTMVDKASSHGSGTLATIIAAVITIFGAFSFFTNLQSSIDLIWEVKPKPDLPWWKSLRNRVVSFLLVGVIALFLLATIGLTTAITGWTKSFSGGVFGKILVYLVDITLSLGVYTLLFGAVYKFVPDVKISWRDTWVGGGITALLFLIGKYGLGFYLSRGSATSVFGAAGSLAALLVWIYYSSQIFFFGAEFTQVYSRRKGDQIVPDEDAMPIEGAQRAKAGASQEKRSGSPTRPPAEPEPRFPGEGRMTARPVLMRDMAAPRRSGWTPGIMAAGGLALGVAAGVASWLREKHDPVRHARLDLTKWRLDKLESRLGNVQRVERRAREIDLDRRLGDMDQRVHRVVRELHKKQWK